MRITSRDSIGDVRLVDVRRAFQKLRQRDWGRDTLGSYLDLDPERLDRLIDVLIDDGYVEPSPRTLPNEERWRMTTKGYALANATAAKPVKRATAQKALDDLLERAAAVNRSADFAFWVDKIVLFGSLLTFESDHVGDVDVAVTLSRRTNDPEAFKRKCEERIEVAHEAGRTFSSFIDQLAWPENEVLLSLKSRSRVLSLTSGDDPILKQATTKVVFERDGAEQSE